MLAKKITEIMIYESPDGGKTVYSRQSGSTDRVLVKADEADERLWKRISRWIDILQVAEKNPILDEMIEKVEVYYLLLKDNE